MPTTYPTGSHRTLHLRGHLLPDGLEADVWVVDGRITWRPAPHARTVASGGWILPALVDAHLHIGISEIGGPLDLDVLSADLDRLARTGVGGARILGSPEPLPAWTHATPAGPLLQSAGVPVAAGDRFIPGWGHRTSGAELPAACTAELAGASGAGSHGDWGKIIADWFDDAGGYGPSFSPEELTRAVTAVHRAGGRVAVHTQDAETGQAAVAAGADSVEHGMHLPAEALAGLAAAGGFLVPTGTVFAQLTPSMTAPEVPAELRTWFATGVEAHPGLVRSALERDVTVLAGTDLPVGALVDEIMWLHEAGMSSHDAIGAASWRARQTLGLPCLREGERADLIWMEDDPREDLESLRSPGLVVLGGKPVQ